MVVLVLSSVVVDLGKTSLYHIRPWIPHPHLHVLHGLGLGRVVSY